VIESFPISGSKLKQNFAQKELWSNLVGLLQGGEEMNPDLGFLDKIVPTGAVVEGEGELPSVSSLSKSKQLADGHKKSFHTT
jgi:hypothetical protein